MLYVVFQQYSLIYYSNEMFQLSRRGVQTSQQIPHRAKIFHQTRLAFNWNQDLRRGWSLLAANRRYFTTGMRTGQQYNGRNLHVKQGTCQELCERFKLCSDIDGIMQNRRNSIANALELRLFLIKPSISFGLIQVDFTGILQGCITDTAQVSVKYPEQYRYCNYLNRLIRNEINIIKQSRLCFYQTGSA